MNSIVLVGRLVKDVELRFIATSGTAVASFTVAVDRNYTKKDGTRETDFIPVQLMGKMAENCANYIGKGSLVAVEGSLQIEKYESNGEFKTFTKVAAKNVKFLDTKKNEKENKKEDEFVPKFDISDFKIVEDDDVPF